MEYPSLVFVGREFRNPTELFGTIDHELGHEWFPMLVGSNERRYAWQDEGVNTFVNYFSAERRFPGTSDWAANLEETVALAGTPLDAPLMTMPDRVDPDALAVIAYSKPALALVALRDHVVGRERFDAALREYTRRWSFRHPTPADFFRSIEEAAGTDLSWFWRAFFYGSEPLDIGISAVEMRESRVMITLDRFSSVPFPVELRLAYEDGTTEDVNLSVNIWRAGRQYQALLPAKGRVIGARLWPTPGVPDVNAANDRWGVAPRADVTRAVTGGGLASPIGLSPRK
jgi:aminopeptidase N